VCVFVPAAKTNRPLEIDETTSLSTVTDADRTRCMIAGWNVQQFSRSAFVYLITALFSADLSLSLKFFLFSICAFFLLYNDY